MGNQVAKVTRRTSTTARSKRAFTLIELTVVVIILVVTTALILPGIGRMKSQRKQRDFVPAIRRIFNLARSVAIEEGSTSYLIWDSSANQVVLKRRKTTSETSSATNAPTTGTNSADDVTIASISITDGVEPNRFDLGDASVSEGSWQLEFYPDGTTQAGGVDFTLGGRESHAHVTKQGAVQVADGPMDDPSGNSWPAGDFERRQ